MAADVKRGLALPPLAPCRCQPPTALPRTGRTGLLRSTFPCRSVHIGFAPVWPHRDRSTRSVRRTPHRQRPAAGARVTRPPTTNRADRIIAEHSRPARGACPCGSPTALPCTVRPDLFRSTPAKKMTFMSVAVSGAQKRTCRYRIPSLSRLHRRPRRRG